MKLKTLKSSRPTMPSRIATLTQRPGATPRLTGRKAVDRRAGWLSLHPLCCHCEAEGFTTAAQEVDHISPLWAGGADDDSNFQSLCKPHHEAKTARESAERHRPG